MRPTDFHILGPLEAVAADEKLRLGGPKQRALLALLLLRRNEVVPRERLVDSTGATSRRGRLRTRYRCTCRAAPRARRRADRAARLRLQASRRARRARPRALRTARPERGGRAGRRSLRGRGRRPSSGARALEGAPRRAPSGRRGTPRVRPSGRCAAGARAGGAAAGRIARRAEAAHQPRPALGVAADAARRPTGRDRRGERAPPRERAARHAHGTGRNGEDAACACGRVGAGADRARRRRIRRPLRDRRFRALRPDDCAHALGISEGGLLAEELRDRSLLLVLDNLEQLLDGVTAIGELLAGAPRLRVLTTSRTPLRLYGEHEYPVPPRTLPPDEAGFEALAANDAVRLFAARARVSDPGFELDERRIGGVAAVCRRLDGLPLPIELAAALSKTLPPAAIAERLDVSLDVLSGGPRDVPPRQRALRASFDWTFDTLAPAEQDIFRRLGVFGGGFTRETAYAVAGDVAPLVEHSLVRGHGERFAMLETIRGYGSERLREVGAEDEARERHLTTFVAYAEAEHARLVAGDAESALDALENEHDNIRAAIDWAGATGRLEAEVALLVALRQFWLVRGYIVEGRSRADRAIEQTAGAAPALRASALTHGASVAYRQGKLVVAQAWWEEALALHRSLDDDDEIGRCLGELGSAAFSNRDLDRAQSFYEESAEVFERLGNSMRLAIVLANIGAIAALRGSWQPLRRSRVELRSSSASSATATGSRSRSTTAPGSWSRSDNSRKAGLRCTKVSRSRGLDYREVLAYGLETAGELAYADGEHERAARLLGASVAALHALGVPMGPEEEEGYARTIEQLGGELGAKRVAELHAAGEAARFEDSVGEALELLRV